MWTTGTLARGTWQDSSVFGLPHATDYDADSNASYDVVGNTDGCTTYFEHEKGTDQALADRNYYMLLLLILNLEILILHNKDLN